MVFLGLVLGVSLCRAKGWILLIFVSFPAQDILLFTCSRFRHSPLSVLSDFQELLCSIFDLEWELCYLFFCMFSAGARFALVS